MDHGITTRWGGRKGRYAEFKGAVTRSFDPFSLEPVTFAKAIEYEAWIRARFHPDTLHITHRPTTVSALIEGAQLSELTTFTVGLRDGRKQFHSVHKKAAPSNRLRRLRRVAEAAGAEVVIVLLPELRADTARFWRLERLRQAATIHVGEGQELDQQILVTVHNGAGGRADVRRCLPYLDAQLLDARLAHLHCSGRLRLGLDDEDFRICVTGGDK